jgi:hypothetical protein
MVVAVIASLPGSYPLMDWSELVALRSGNASSPTSTSKANGPDAALIWVKRGGAGMLQYLSPAAQTSFRRHD